MPFQNDPEIIRWKIHLSSPPQEVFSFLTTDDGRKKFWAKTDEETDTITFTFPNGFVWQGKILAVEAPTFFSLVYIGGSEVSFMVKSDGQRGTDLEVKDKGVPNVDRTEVIAGWGSVLMALKGAVDFGIDLRNNDPTRTWDQGYFDN
ncbi:MAG: SRPBCC domain-containing protein [Candidatus Thorarchaeota archaeon]